MGRLLQNLNPITISAPKHSFKEVIEDVNSVCWLPDSATDMIVATEDNLCLCDTRVSWKVKKYIEEDLSKKLKGIRFDPFDTNRFAAYSEETGMIKVYDLR